MEEFVISPDENIIENDLNHHLDVPSIIESLSSSAYQLKQLAKLTSQYYIKGLLSYSYIDEPKLVNDVGVQVVRKTKKLSSNHLIQKGKTQITEQGIDGLDNLANDKRALESLDSVVNMLSFLNDLTCHIEGCFTMIEIAFKRSDYHLNKIGTLSSAKLSQKDVNEFKAPPETRIDCVLVSIMDILYTLISLDETIRSHTCIRESISLLRRTCQAIKLSFENQDDTRSLDDIRYSISESKIDGLLEMIGNIELTLCNDNKTIFQLCLEHLQHLDLILTTVKNRPNNNQQTTNKSISELIEDFIVFYSDCHIQSSQCQTYKQTSLMPKLKSIQDISAYLLQINLAPTIIMTSIEQKILGLSTLFILHNRIFKKFNKKTTIRSFNQLLMKFKSINIINLIGSNSYIVLSSFLKEHLPNNIIDSKSMNQLQNQDEQFYISNNLTQYLNDTTIEVMSLQVQLKALRLDHSSSLTNNLQLILSGELLLSKCLSMIEEINSIVGTTIAVHLKDNRSITKSNLILLSRLVSLLKSIEMNLIDNKLFLIDREIKKEKFLRSKLRRLIFLYRKRSITSKYSDRKLDATSSLILFELCSNLDRLKSEFGRCILSMAISMLAPYLEPNELSDLNLLLSLMKPNLYDNLRRISNCSYVYWIIPAFNSYYNYVFEEDPVVLAEVVYFHRAINDIRDIFLFDSLEEIAGQKNHLDWLIDKRDKFLHNLGDELLDQFKLNTLDKICQELEIELRLQTHRDLQLDGHNPFRRHLYNFKRIFSNNSLKFNIFDRFVELKQYVERHMSENYYNLISIAPHDWFTYDCMIDLAKRKYGLHLTNSQMPTQTLDCGVDLLEITRNLSLFVSKYTYDMSNQLFIEKCTNRSISTSSAASLTGSHMTQSINNNSTMYHHTYVNQSLNVIQIRHVSMSLQNHGFGLLNSAINCIYQLLKRLVKLVSRQLADQRLMVALTKEQQQLHSNLTHSTITFDRANKLARKFKILNATTMDQPHQSTGSGSNSHSSSIDLDSLRQSITQLGNSLAFMRLLKSGALNCASKSVNYLPDLDDISLLRLEKLVRSEFNHSYDHFGSLKNAATNFDTCLDTINENFSPKTDYFQIVLNLFSEGLRQDKKQTSTNTIKQNQIIDMNNKTDTKEEEDKQQTDHPIKATITNKSSHLELFYILIPSLTITYIDYIINAKERIVSRSSANRVGALISDDGFPLGVAFLLTVLNQSIEFGKLEWFREVGSKLNSDQAEVRRKIGNPKYEESLKQTSSMTLRRLTKLKSEYDSLGYNLNSALLLFRSSMRSSSRAS